jgi:hypothetical protein
LECQGLDILNKLTENENDSIREKADLLIQCVEPEVYFI